MSQVNADKIAPSTGTILTIGDAGDTITTAGTTSGFGKVLQVIHVTDMVLEILHQVQPM